MAELEGSQKPQHEGYLWPSADYDRQLAAVRDMIGQSIYLVLLKPTDINLAVTLESTPVTLLEVVDFPAPDPARRLYPHMLILSDGRGINLGHIARLSHKQAFNPQAEQIIYQQDALLQQLLFQERRLSPQTIQRTSRVQLGRILGKAEPRRLD
ncbi:hypothetical protein [Thiohalophilus thiocyanatoxydans]|uniref:Uncharacterized protein n=1 Tax=Thiohalophilus thiocyanatoxydans TaxID=381308 RepID=A0A4R8IP38_9GAMM|nr:hypothetical protein [Thiohalophilus thiocyanatoxydans]TDX97941.1 hypothetical protein EDC23_2746 [Thiohalophilus thiocyanatoxydans]